MKTITSSSTDSIAHYRSLVRYNEAETHSNGVFQYSVGQTSSNCNEYSVRSVSDYRSRVYTLRPSHVNPFLKYMVGTNMIFPSAPNLVCKWIHVYYIFFRSWLVN